MIRKMSLGTGGSGKVALVTGASSGLGQATALELARLGASVVLLCRDETRGRAALEAIRSATGNRRLALRIADLASQEAIRRFAAGFLRDEERLDILVHNAAVFRLDRHETRDGIEETLAVNHLAPFLMTHLLLPLLSATAGSRIVVVSSDAHSHAGLDLADLEGRTAYDGYLAYARSKLANLLFTYALARRLGPEGPAVNAAAPGVVATEIVRDLPEELRTKWARMGKSAEEGARVIVRLAVSPELSGVTGRYFRNEGEAASSLLSRDEELQEGLWQASARMTGLPA
jgi:retinol dehydrogenase-14